MMPYLKLIACAICVHIVICEPKQPSNITEDMYHVLSSKIDTINLELALKRNEQVQTKQDLLEAKTEIQRMQGNQTALEQQLSSLKETVLGLSIPLEENCQSGEFGPHSRPSYPVNLTINFRPAFKRRPAIVYGLKVLDSAHNVNVRVGGFVMEMTNAYFKFQIRAWANTIMYEAKFSWMACPRTQT
ncbi:uncharacterized protein LOC128242314 [Mya arenaria]|uniref:uncharacterized protein LOC128242314 n=1 Tax=Mya arenaria TaxID=6604 RepID=UPI0022E24C19|nr:uncharacterized protein LOC128242314 [Mya arenaria]